ncbi:MAG: DUF4058 family protein [Planctomycetes bacterium]|nr:DUF4058 family protein [Planctomycetota bacterium]
MPIHDWTKVSFGTFHNFHQGWIITLRDALNAGRLPEGYFAMAEQVIGRPEADVVALDVASDDNLSAGRGGMATAVQPRTTFVLAAEEERYASRATHLAVHHGLGRVVAIIEIISPGNKSSRHALRSFGDKAIELIRQGVNLLVVDLFPPGPRDPKGVHPLIWDEISDQPFALPPGKPLTLAAYQCAPTKTAFIEPAAVGDLLPEMPLFLRGEWHVQVPLEETYRTAWDVMPSPIKRLFDVPSR